jgi:hypothetical protein
MRNLPNFKVFKECPLCKNWEYGQYDNYCSRCGAKLTDHDEWLASISDYAKSLLIDFLQSQKERSLDLRIEEIPDCAAEEMQCNGNILFNQQATRKILAENWNEVEIALVDWHERTGLTYQWSNIENLHVFSVVQHVEMAWREVVKNCETDYFSEEELDLAIEILKQH